MDHKLLIVLNKADQFQRMHDFARAYGSLCWNLSKVIPCKNLPRIYTMCLPNDSNSDSNSDSDKHKAKWSHRVQQLSFFTAGMGTSSLATFYTSIPHEYTGSMLAFTILGVGGLHWFHDRQLQEIRSFLTSPQELDHAFQRTHTREIDDYTASVWHRIKETVQLSLSHPQDMPSISPKSDIEPLKDILEKDIPSLRRKASPSHFGCDP